MPLYSYKGQIPTTLPFRITLSDGRTRTDPETFTPEEIADAGYVEVTDAVITNSEIQIAEWSSNTISWVVRDYTPEEIAGKEGFKRYRQSVGINAERDHRIQSGFTFANTAFDSKPEDQKRISGAALLAFMAIVTGQGEANNYAWAGANTTFAWISQNNDIIPMDAPTMVEFGKTAAEWERSHIFAARQLKDMDPIPADYANNVYWPSK